MNALPDESAGAISSDQVDAPGTFEAIYRSYSTNVLRFVAAGLPQCDHAQDISQEVWLAVRDGLASFDKRSSILSWVLGIAKHKVGDFRRRFSRRVDLVEDVTLEALLNQLGPRINKTHSTSAIQLARDIQHLRAALERFDEEDRDLLCDRYVVGLSPAEIVRERNLNVPANTLSQRLVRLTRKVREVLNPPAR